MGVRLVMDVIRCRQEGTEWAGCGSAQRRVYGARRASIASCRTPLIWKMEKGHGGWKEQNTLNAGQGRVVW